MRPTWLLFVAGIGVAASAQILTPREIFYSERLPAKTPERPRSAPAKPTAAKGPEKAPTAPEIAASSSTPSNTTSSPLSNTPAPSNSSNIRQVEYRVKPLGLRYSLLRQDASGAFREADPREEFVSGDRVRLAIESSDEGHLYVVSQGSSGVWKVLYPAPGGEPGGNRALPNKRYEIPSATQAFTFNDQAGEERLFVILSRKPEADLEKLIPSLNQQRSAPVSDQPKTPAQGGASLLAENLLIKNEIVENYRAMYSRDLLVETVTPATPATQNRPKPVEAVADEKAVYVVNPKAGEDGRVVADILLIHK